MSDESPVFLFDGDDPEMQQSWGKARESFRFFWRELSWERRRIIPGLSVAAVKAPFSDGDQADPESDDPQVEHMWIDEVEFDGKNISGVLLNEPSWLKTVNQGDQVKIPLSEISDWMYAVFDRVYGAYTVNLMRSRMERAELKQHDAAWGLDFGDPNQIEVVPADWAGKKKGGFLKKLFGGGGGEEEPGEPLEEMEHPMSVHMDAQLEEVLAEDPSMANDQGEDGWTLLHQQALAGSGNTVATLLKHGADPTIVTNHGMTARALAESIGWTKVIGLLDAAANRT